MTRHRKPGKHKPVHPGEVLMLDFVHPAGLTVYHVAGAAGISADHVRSIALGQMPVTPHVAMALAQLFGNSEQFWLGLQAQYDAEMDSRS